MTALHWSLLVACMKRVSCWPWTNSAYVLKFDGVIGVRCNTRAVILPSCAILPSEYTTIMLITALHWSSLVDCMERVSCRSCTIRSYVCITACEWSNSTVLLVLDAVGPAYQTTSCNFIFMRHFAFRIQHYNINNGRAPIFVGWMYGTGAVLTLDEQRVRLYCCMRVIKFDGVINWFQNTTIMLITALYWSLLVECLKRVSCRPWTNSSYVCTAACDSECVFIGVRCSRTYDEAASCNFTLMCRFAFRIQQYNVIMAVHWSSLVECMDRVSCWSWTNRPYVCIAFCCVRVIEFDGVSY